MRVGDLASGRSGDKGDMSNIGVVARRPAQASYRRAATRRHRRGGQHRHQGQRPGGLSGGLAGQGGAAGGATNEETPGAHVPRCPGQVADALEATIRSIVFDDGVIPETRHSDEESTDDDEA